ncbi:hypothetical protein CAP36_12935 [Chitinophagaceae bacterium IBVUCB2]|nr:hypothetical protein CAP36_12935 [Chitinophagaceae bacterium IBVUCB2]
MKYQIKNLSALKKLLWLDFALGFITAIIGLLFYSSLAKMFGLTGNLVFTLAIVNLLYSIFAFSLATQKNVSISLLRILIYANWVWTAISVLLLFLHFENATNLGRIFLVLQIPVVGLLAFLEGNQVIRRSLVTKKIDS